MLEHLLRRCDHRCARASHRGGLSSVGTSRQVYSSSLPAYFLPAPFPDLPELLRIWNNFELPPKLSSPPTGPTYARSRTEPSPFDEEPLIPLIFDLASRSPICWLRPQVVRQLRASRLAPVYSPEGDMAAMAFGPTMQKRAPLLALSSLTSRWRREGTFKELLHGKCYKTLSPEERTKLNDVGQRNPRSCVRSITTRILGSVLR
jgi:hypothetical protein